eukprot:355754-Chlamydomonas_euryale.AAC.8
MSNAPRPYPLSCHFRLVLMVTKNYVPLAYHISQRSAAYAHKQGLNLNTPRAHPHAFLEQHHRGVHDVRDRDEVQALLGHRLGRQERNALNLQQAVVEAVRHGVCHPLCLRTATQETRLDQHSHRNNFPSVHASDGRHQAGTSTIKYRQYEQPQPCPCTRLHTQVEHQARCVQASRRTVMIAVRTGSSMCTSDETSIMMTARLRVSRVTPPMKAPAPTSAKAPALMHAVTKGTVALQAA